MANIGEEIREIEVIPLPIEEPIIPVETPVETPERELEPA